MQQNVNITLDLNKLVDDSIGGPIKSISNTLSALWGLTFGRIDHLNEKLQLKYALDLDSFRKELEGKINAIPEEKLCEPNVSIVGPTLEGAKYYFNEIELRSLFANLIASSMNKDKVKSVRTAFTSIIQQLDKVDAINLQSFRYKHRHPIARGEIMYSSSRYRDTINRYEYIFFGDTRIEPMSDMMSSSLENLSRLGLIEISFSRWFNGDRVYIPYSNLETIHKYTRGVIDMYEKPDGVFEIEKGIVLLTSLGHQFVDTCLE